MGTVSPVPEPQLRRLDPADDADMDAFQDVYVAAELAEDPEAALYSREDGVSILSSRDGGTIASAYGAFVDGLMVGEAMVVLPQRDSLDTARVYCWVRPDHQRHGVGTDLIEQVHAVVRAAGRHVCQATGRIGRDRDNGNVRFARRLGYELANTELARRLPLPADTARLEALATEAEKHHAAYRVRVAIGPVPDDLAASYLALSNRLAVEAPTGSLEMEAGGDTLAELAAQERQLAESGRMRVGAYAVDAGGVVVGYSIAAVSNATYHHVDQWGTLVDPAHRGHRLGLAVKCALLRELSESFPDKRFVETTNAESNAPMVAINEALGFEVAQVWGDFQARLT